jgi:hypothetical protein
MLWYGLILAALARPLPEGSPPPPPDSTARAEYHRLSQELMDLTTRNVWSGVERLFLEIEETRVEPTHDILLAGAHSSRALGDVRASQARLERALMLQENAEVVSWLNEIHQHYGSVFIACQAKKKRASLESSERPFSPMLQQAIAFAQDGIEQHCFFDGMLPAGTYTLTLPDGWSSQFEVVPRVAGLRIDLRSERQRPASRAQR